MDLHFLSAEATDAERAAVDSLFGPAPPGYDGSAVIAEAGLAAPPDAPLAVPVNGSAGPSADGRGRRGGGSLRRDLLLPALHAVNDTVGWISQGALNYVCQRLEVPPAEAYGVASFYALFALDPRPPRVVHVCTDIACKANGADALTASLEQRFGSAGQPGAVGQNGGDGQKGAGATWLPSPCLGLCERAPAALAFQAGTPAREHVVAPADVEAVVEVARSGLDNAHPEPEPRSAVPQAGDQSLLLLRRVGVVDPTNVDDYRAHGGYQALRKALKIGPAGVIREVTDSGLMGRGGAAFPTGRKWQATATQVEHPHYLVCNADESEPGTFKDRVLMEGDPFAVIEAMTIAAYATHCPVGYLYIRGEYPRALHRLENALARARERGFLGRNIMGSGFDFDVEIRRGAGAYICGEETAIFNSIEGFRGEPRNKPPFPVEKGLFGKPTVVNNVETLVNVLPILTEGGLAFAQIGTGTSTGPKLFCVSGNVRRPGLYEVPFGTTLGELLDLAGGPPEGRSLRAVLLGGAAGGFVRPDETEVPLTFEGTREAGTTLGSGVVLAFDDTVDLPGILLRIASFFRDESCGQCVPCRVGTVRQEEALHRLVANRPLGSAGQDLALLREVGTAMKDASICGLGQTAWNAVESAIDRLGTFEEASTP